MTIFAARSHALGAQECARRFPTNLVILLFQICQLATQIGANLAIILLSFHLLQLLLQVPLLVDEGCSQLGGLLKPALGLRQVRLKGTLGLDWRSSIQAEQLGVER